MNDMKRNLLLLFSFVLMLVLSGCRSSRHATRKADVTTGASQIVYPGDSQDNRKSTDDKQSGSADKSKEVKRGTDVSALTSKMNLTLESGGKRINLGGTYRLKRNEVVQLNLTYTMIFTLNVGTLELTSDYILVLDRLNKRYCRVRYDEVPSLVEAGVTFDALQRVFWGEAPESPTPLLEWTYSDWQPLGNGQFPCTITFASKAKGKSYKATFDLAGPKQNADWETRTEVTSKYTPISLDAVMKALMSVAK